MSITATVFLQLAPLGQALSQDRFDRCRVVGGLNSDSPTLASSVAQKPDRARTARNGLGLVGCGYNRPFFDVEYEMLRKGMIEVARIRP
jgi:hypothetical protein